jgi:hypothetical protein
LFTNAVLKEEPEEAEESEELRSGLEEGPEVVFNFKEG